MDKRTPLLTAAAFTLILLVLAVTDATVSRVSSSLPSPFAADAGQQAQAKDDGPAVEDILQERGLEIASSDEKGVIQRIVPEATGVRTHVILKDGDRLALLSWMESPQVKTYFSALKNALLTSFSADVRDLRDETLSGEGKPTVNFLTFIDPAIAPERIVFLRVRERLLELHIVAGKDADVAALLTEFSR